MIEEKRIFVELTSSAIARGVEIQYCPSPRRLAKRSKKKLKEEALSLQTTAVIKRRTK